MPRYIAEWAATDRQTNATATATKAAVVGHRHYVTGITVSASAAPAAAVEVQLLSGGATSMDDFEVPANAFAVIRFNYDSPLRGGIGEAITLVLPALGAAVVGNVVINGYTRRE